MRRLEGPSREREFLYGENMRQQILVIDDTKSIHALVKALLAEEQVDVHSATEAAYGLNLAASMKPDLILLDIDMPGMNGFDVCRKLKGDPGTSQVPIIFLTAVSTIQQKVKGLELGAVDYITKPFHNWELWARVRATLRMNHLVQLLEEKALLDPLTGLGNRAMYDRQIESEIATRIRFATPLSCIVMDVDQFKEINDTWGHPFGDGVLKSVSGIIAAACRTGDIACRYGGDEFVVISPHTSAADAVLLARRIQEGVAKTEFKREGQTIPISVSIGVADAGDLYDRTMFHRADDAMYCSKEKGGNCVTMTSSEPNTKSAAA
jgi:two-component system, cell cycle response regulator